MLPVADISPPHTSPVALETRLSSFTEGKTLSPMEAWSRSLLSQYSSKTTQPVPMHSSYVLLVDGQPVILVLKDESHPDTSQDTSTSQPVPIGDRLDLIKAQLDLSITQMAELFGVTRKSIYDWYEGKGQRSSTSNKMEVLIDALKKTTNEVDLRRLKFVWNIAVSGKSFREVFGDDQLHDTTLQNALEKKLNELSPRMVATAISTRKTTVQIGEAHLAEFDRRADFG
jgi:hypothetical protein